MCHDGHALLDEVAKCEEGGLDGPFHGADEDEAHVELLGNLGEEVGFEIGALLAAEFSEFRVVEAVVLWDVLVNGV